MSPAVVVLVAMLVCARAQAAAPDPRIVAVERGLLPPVLTDRTRPMHLAERMRHYGVPGLSIAVVDNGQLAWAKAWGVAQRGQAQRLTTSTLMQAASISKPVAALGAFKLADQGRIDLDADVNTLLRSWKLPPGAQTAGKPVTVRGLLSHTAGLTTHGFPGYVPGQPVPSLPQILDGVPPANSEAVRVSTPPGAESRYSGGGYVVLQQVMEDVTGEPFAAWMQREVLASAGMAWSLFGALPDAPLSRAAVGHRAGRVIPGRRATHPEQAAAALWTTPSDLARLTLALQQVLAGQPSPWLQRSRLVEALRPALPGPSMGTGFFLEGGGAFFGHDGSNAGFESRWRADGQRAVILMANANGAMPLIDEVLRAVAAAHGWADVMPPQRTVQQLLESYAAVPIFLRGSMNDWGVSAPLRPLAPGRFAAEVELPAGTHEFKFGSKDWRTVDLGAAFGPRGPQLGVQGPNLMFVAKQPGRWRFTLDLRDPAAPRYAVKRLAP